MSDIAFERVAIPTSAGSACMSVALRRQPLNPRRPLLVFLHGLVQPVSSFLPAVDQFLTALKDGSDELDLLLYDRFGAGQSDKDPRQGVHTLPLVVEDLRNLLRHCLGGEEEVDPTPMIFVAHSIGGAIVRYYAQQYPSTSIEGILFLDPMIASTDFVSIYQPRDGEKPSQEELDELKQAREISRRLFHPSLPNAEGFDRSTVASLLPRDSEPKLASKTRQPCVIVVAHDRDVNVRDMERKLGMPQRATRNYLEPRWEQYNRSLLTLTTPERARGPLVAGGADHFIQTARPDVVAQELRFLWDSIQLRKSEGG